MGQNKSTSLFSFPNIVSLLCFTQALPLLANRDLRNGTIIIWRVGAALYAKLYIGLG